MAADDFRLESQAGGAGATSGVHGVPGGRLADMHLAASTVKYVCFQLAGKYYAIPQHVVREMMPVQAPLPVGSEYPAVLGVIHSKHRRIPVIDLCQKLNVRKRLRRRPQRMIIACAENRTSGTVKLVAFFVDTISDVLQVHLDETHRGVIHGHGRPKIILSLKELVTEAELDLFG